MFTTDDLDRVTACVVAAWRSGLDRDWSARAGSVDWTCLHTADHAQDAVLAVALFLASGRRDDYPDWGFGEMGDAATPAKVVEAMATAGRIVSAVVATAKPGDEAIIWLRPTPTVRPAGDFAPRAGIEMLLHAHDVCTGLGVTLAPPGDACARLREHTRGWPHWSGPGWSDPASTDDPWRDLLVASGRG